MTEPDSTGADYDANCRIEDHELGICIIKETTGTHVVYWTTKFSATSEQSDAQEPPSGKQQ